MGQVIGAQRWGLASLAEARIKGGWGPGVHPGQGDGWMERQMGLASIAGQPVAVALASTASDHTTGIRSLNAMAAWLAEHLHASGPPQRPSC
jgi:hypothetical protein